ncbi:MULTISPECIES: hypothetical protein [Cyanophyceae]|uniref:hypothetical protein n=2 Tax=Cyanobacteriota TaxID=1117 RepID=UPI00232DF570|nr:MULTISPECIES: hypothetical protein [Cyanophyceae]MDB9356209.1 hypothetical protein [Nodularia spumigena CS-587/03]MDB9303368.1 hypothetical protein [Nodularia spumigena CS-591/12]MDB9317147.1 hypothetical protein [Nodularia spumigena CS-590/01A]MDB9325689.1 hypothetical protein [Nodularia spumigena CS-590/02]MDB9339996.1 hypothetical protein [Nodularia spumigena CS-589/07]
MPDTSNLISEFETLFRQKLKLNNCKLKKKKQENNYEIITPAKDIFLMSWCDFPDINLIYQPIGVRTQQTGVYEKAIRSHINFCLSSIKDNTQTAV